MPIALNLYGLYATEKTGLIYFVRTVLMNDDEIAELLADLEELKRLEAQLAALKKIQAELNEE